MPSAQIGVLSGRCISQIWLSESFFKFYIWNWVCMLYWWKIFNTSSKLQWAHDYFWIKFQLWKDNCNAILSTPKKW